MPDASPIAHRGDPSIVWIVSEKQAGCGDRGIAEADGTKRVVSIVGVNRSLLSLIRELSQPAGGVLVHVSLLRAVVVLFGRAPALNVHNPGSRAPHGIGD